MPNHCGSAFVGPELPEGTEALPFPRIPSLGLRTGGDFGVMENSEDSLLMLYNNPAIIVAEVLNFLSILTYAQTPDRPNLELECCSKV